MDRGHIPQFIKSVMEEAEQPIEENQEQLSNGTFHVPTVAELKAKGEEPELLFWVGCAGAFDDRYQEVTRDFVKILEKVGIKYAVLGTEESCTGDPAKRAGNEFVYQMQAMGNIEVLNGYNIKKMLPLALTVSIFSRMNIPS